MEEKGHREVVTYYPTTDMAYIEFISHRSLEDAEAYLVSQGLELARNRFDVSGQMISGVEIQDVSRQMDLSFLQGARMSY